MGARIFCLLVLAVACTGGDDPAPVAAPLVGDTEEPVPVVAEGLPQGTFLVGLSIAAIGGLVVPLQIEVQTLDAGDGPRFERFDVRAVGDDDSVSDLLVSVTGVEVDPAGGFDVVLPRFTLPGEYVITGGDVDVDVTLLVEEIDERGLCGSVAGNLVTFDIDLVGSSFGAVPWADRALGVATSCSPTQVEELPRLDAADCPTLVAGANTGFPSGGRDRSFEVVLPSDGPGPFPLVLVYHGFGGDAVDMLDGTGLRPYADALGVILISAQGESLGTEGWDGFSDPLTNPDLALFDDLVTCASASFEVDPERIHVTGMSNGGLMSGYLVATRSDVIASAAPLSGGVSTDVLDTGYDMPVLVVWGGPSDLAFDQDFDLLAQEQIDLYTGRGQFVVACDHDLGHTLLPSFWPWVLQFLLDHPRGVSPAPYAGGLPAVFPDYCTVP